MKKKTNRLETVFKKPTYDFFKKIDKKQLSLLDTIKEIQEEIDVIDLETCNLDEMLFKKKLENFYLKLFKMTNLYRVEQMNEISEVTI